MAPEDPAPPVRRTLAEALVELYTTIPGKVAITEGTRKVDYEEAIGRASALAEAIIARGAGGTGPVAVLGDRGPDLMVAVLATILAGRGFVIVEAEQPRERVHEIIGLVGEGLVVLADAGLAPVLPADSHWVALGSEAKAPELTYPTPNADEVGYVVFTSGSTGRPKGVISTFSDLEDRIERRQDPERLERRGDTSISHAPLSYAAGLSRVFDLFAGNTIEMFDVSRQGPLAFAEWLDQRGFERLSMVPSLARAILAVWPAGRRLESVKRISTHGEGLHWADVQPLRDLAGPELEIQVGYASSEAGGLLEMKIGPDDPIASGVIPLGTPRKERDIRLERVDGEPGAPTEIVVYGGRLAAGYWRDPLLTAARFGVTEDGTRFYRTGDLAFQREDGLYMHRGRADDLVKIRGLLVEPAESERVLRGLAGVASASVLAHPSERSGHRLVGHVVPAKGSSLDPLSLRKELAAHLPAHLVPSVLVRHDVLPITERGKVDRTALRSAELEPWRTEPPAPLMDELETMVAAALELVLELPAVGRRDSVWDLGADSLAVQELAVILEDRTGVGIDLARVIEASTVAEIADQLRSGVERRDELIWLNRGGSEPPLVCVPGAGGTALAYRLLAQELGPDQPLLVLEAHGMHTPGRPDREVDAAARRFVARLDEAGLKAPHRLLGFSAGGVIAYELARQLLERGDEVAALVIVDTAPGGRGVHVLPRSGEVSGWVGDLRNNPVETARFLAAGASRRARRMALRRLAGRRRTRTADDYFAFTEIAIAAAARYQATRLPEGAPRVLLVHAGRPELAAAWRNYVELDEVSIPGEHMALLAEPRVKELAAAVAERLGASPRTG